MPNYTATGLVLHRTNLGETDRVLTLFTGDRGKISAVAKGCRKSTSRLSGATELFTLSSFLLGQGRSLEIVSQCEIRESFPNIRADLQKLARAAYLCELLDRTTQEHDDQMSSELLELTLVALRQLENEDYYLDGSIHSYELQLMDIQGYAPVLMECAVCGNADLGNSPGFSPVLGGVLCKADRQRTEDCQQISTAAVILMRQLFYSESAEWPKTPPTRSVAIEIDRALRWYIRYRIDRDIKSKEFLDQLRADS